MHHPDYCIAGAGIIGLSLALELHRRGASVVVLDRAAPIAEASTAAAGMLAASDPENPSQLRALADLSLSLYPDYLARLEGLSSLRVPFQTTVTLQSSPSYNTADADLSPYLSTRGMTFRRLQEHSVDPRQLAAALLASAELTPIDLRPHTPFRHVRCLGDSVEVQTSSGIICASSFIDCTGAWVASASGFSVVPKKGQMLSVTLPRTLPLDVVIRTPELYIVPRTQGPGKGLALIGATVEDKGFDKTVDAIAIARLHAEASFLLPQLASAPVFETWAGLRPATLDGLPLLGPIVADSRHFLATGHFRNGILLAPATAHVMAQLLFHEAPVLDLSPFAPSRRQPRN